MVGHGEPVRLVPDGLKQFEGAAVPVNYDRIAAAGNEHLFVAFGQPDDRKRRTPQRHQRIDRGRELPLAAVDDHQVRERLFLLQNP